MLIFMKFQSGMNREVCLNLKKSALLVSIGEFGVQANK